MTNMTNMKPSETNSEYKIEETDEMSWEEIEQEISEEIDSAIKFQKENVVSDRIKKWDRYYGRPFGNEIPGRSQYMSRDLLETVEWILPNLIRMFSSKDMKVGIKIHPEDNLSSLPGGKQVNPQPQMGSQPQLSPKQLGDALMSYIFSDLSSDEAGGLFLVFYTWFKDALVSGSAYTKLFWEVDSTLANFSEIADQERYRTLSTDPSVTIASSELSPTGQVKVQGTFEKISKDNLVCDNIPHWEFIFEEHTRTMNDDTGKGFVTVVTLDYLRRMNRAYSTKDQEFFYNLDLVEAVASGSYRDYGDYDLDSEKQNFFNYQVLNDYVGAKRKGPKRRIQLAEWYTQLDVNGDGFLEDIRVWRANGVLIRWEINELGFIPCSKISPIIDCYKFQGIAYADLLIELQELKSMLMRKILDNFDFMNQGRWFVKPGVPIDIKRFMEGIPGDIFRVDPNQISNEAPQGFDSSNISLLEYVEGIKENRTGSTRYNQGTDADSLNQTAHGIQTIMDASLKRIQLIGALFAEGGLKDFYMKAALLCQQNLSKPFSATIMGDEVKITPDMIQGRLEVYTELGADEVQSHVDAQKLLQISAVLGDLDQKHPGLLPPEKVYSLAAKYVETQGFEANNFIASKEQFEKAQQQTQQLQQQLQKMQEAIQNSKMQLEKEGIEIDKIQAIGDIIKAKEKIEADLEIAKMKTNEGREASLRDTTVNMLQEINKAEMSMFNRPEKTQQRQGNL